MLRNVIGIFLITLNLLGAHAQGSGRGDSSSDPLTDLKEKATYGDVSVYLDSLVEDHYYRHIVYNSRNAGISGYRIRIFSDNGNGAKDRQRKARERFMTLFPEIDAYYPYEGSYYKIYVGDYRTKRDAVRALDEIKRKFPDAFIVSDNIRLKK